MLKLNEKMADKISQPCPLYEEGFIGRCTDCGSRQECISLSILGKMQKIEAKLDSLAGK